MRPICLGVIFDQQIHAGGGYQQALNAALLSRQISDELANVVFFTTKKENIAVLAGYGISADFIRLSFWSKLKALVRRGLSSSRFFKLIKRFERYSSFEKSLVENKVDLVYFLSASSLALDLEELNYITTVWDLCHRDDPEFPEVRLDREFEIRDRNYRAILPRATAIFVDSELGKGNAVRRYGLDAERIYVMPFQAAKGIRNYSRVDSSGFVNICEKYKINVPYVFYPAQFWAHKNHIYLLEGLNLLERLYGLRVGAIFSGGDKGNRAYVERYACDLGIEDRVRFSGFIENEEMPEVYRQAVALVMPTYFGPTNLPPLEAFQLGVPVLYSDKAGLSEQVGDAALLMDLSDPKSMADHLKCLITDDGLRCRLIQAGRARLAYFDSKDRAAILRSVIENFRWRRLCWE